MRILKNEEYDNMRATIKRLLDENLQLKQDIYALKRENNFLRFRGDNFKSLSFPNSEIKDERSVDEIFEDMNNTVSQMNDLFRKTLYGGTGTPDHPEY